MLLIKSFFAAPSLPVENVYFVPNLGTDFSATLPPENFIPPPLAKYVFSQISFYDQTWLRPLVLLYGLRRQDLVKSLLQKSMVPKFLGTLVEDSCF